MKRKGRIHPSPAAAGASGGDAMAVLKLLPTAILTLVAVLNSEDKEVLAYLMTQSMMPEERRQEQKVDGGAHRPALDCGCFACYTSFWSRWDRSPDRELIHQAIEAFEEHLVPSDRASRSRRKDRRAASATGRVEKGKKTKGKEKRVELEVEDDKIPTDVAEEKVEVEESEAEKRTEDENEEAAVEVMGAAPATGEKKRGWADVIGIFNSRLWNLWSPGD